MEKEVTEGLSQIQQLYVAIGALVTVIISLVGALRWMFVHSNKDKEQLRKLSERNIETHIDLKRTIEANTQAVRDLPHNIMLEIRAASAGPIKSK